MRKWLEHDWTLRERCPAFGAHLPNPSKEATAPSVGENAALLRPAAEMRGETVQAKLGEMKLEDEQRYVRWCAKQNKYFIL